MANKRNSVVPLIYSGCTVKRIHVAFAVGVCLWMVAIVTVVGLMLNNDRLRHVIRLHIPIQVEGPISPPALQSTHHKDTDSTPINISREDNGFIHHNIKTLVQGVAFSDVIRDRLVADVTKRERARPNSWRSDETQYMSDDQFVNYMKCPTSVRKKLLMHPYFHDRYLPEVPMLMWSKHYSDEEYSRLSNFHSIYGWDIANASVISSALNALNTSSNTYLFDRDRKPGQDGCTSCAVIGNGGILNGSKKGREIDSHDYVFRVNVAVTKGHEEDVGNKTSFYCALFRSLRISLMSGSRYGFRAPPYQEGIRYVFFPKTELAFKFIAGEVRNQPELLDPVERRSVPNFQTKLTSKDLKLVHPDFERYLKFRWVNSSQKYQNIHRPSTGAIMLLLALHTCDKVDAYGFGGALGKYTGYYYHKQFSKQKVYTNHDTKNEIRLWRELHQLGVINLYTRE